MTEEQELVANTARKVGERFGVDYWRLKDGQKQFPWEFWDHIRALGLTGTALPIEYNGSGLGMTEMAIIIENLAAAGAGATVAQLFMIGPIFGGYSISRYGI